MAPIRRYLRITKYSVLECRIYLDNPALAQTWLLNPRDPVLPRVIESVRPLVLPKLTEERERELAKKKNKKKTIKDVVVTDEFEVSIFLTPTDTRHSLLLKHKHFRDKVQTKLTSNSSRLTGASREAPVDLDNDDTVNHPLQQGVSANVPVLLEEDEDNAAINLHDIPAIDDTPAVDIDNDDDDDNDDLSAPTTTSRRPKRRRRGVDDDGETQQQQQQQAGKGPASNAGGVNVHDATETTTHSSDDDQQEEDELFVSDDSNDSNHSDRSDGARPPTKRRKAAATAGVSDQEQPENKKKPPMHISYEGFAIYGRVLCLVVKRRGGGSGGRAGSSTLSAGGGGGGKSQTEQQRPGGQAMMENWITSTQMPPPDETGWDDEAP